MTRSFYVILHATFWLGYTFLVSIILYAALQGQEIPPADYDYYFSFIVGIGILPPVLSFYGHYFYVFRRYLQQQKILLSLVASLGISALAIFTGVGFVYLTSSEAFGCIQTGYPYAMGFSLILTTLLGVIALVLKGFLTWYEELKLKEELLEKTHRMEMALVKSQLDPHFLFNTLNNIDVLIEKDPTKASTYLKQLSDIMRFMLYHTKGPEIPLKKELEYIEKYIELQKIRTANPNYVSYELEGDPTHKQVAPMVFIPFIENAFKHATNKKVDQAVDIHIQVEPEAITFHCKNHYDSNKKVKEGENGLGNELIEKRLSLLYPDQHRLQVSKEQEMYQVELILQHDPI